MFEYGYNLDSRKLEKALRKYGKSFTTDDPLVHKGWEVVHRVFMSQQKKNFIARGRGETVNGIGWPRIAPLTAALRRKGRAKKIRTEKQLQAKASKSPPLRDTGMLLGSLDVGDPKNIRKIGIMRVAAGTRIKYARKQHEGRASKPRPVRQSLERLEKNIAKVTKAGDPGERKGRTYNEDGTKVLVRIPGVGMRWVPRAKKWHNPLYYKLRAAVKKKRTIRPPKRRVLLQPSKREVALLTKVWAKVVLVPLAKRFNKEANG